MKNIKKRIISLLASVVTAASALSASYTSAFAEEQTTDTALSSSADTEVKTGGILGSLMAEEMKHFTIADEQDDEKDFVIYKLDFSENKEKLILNYKAQNRCAIFVGFYNDEGTQLYTSLNEELSAGSDEYMLFDVPELPYENYLVRAYIVGSLNEPLSKPFENKESTKAVQDIMKKTPDNFDDNKIIRFSDDDDYNFIVTKNEFKTINSDSTKDTLANYDEENGVMTFENIDKFKEIEENQDVLVYTPDDMLYFRVDSIEINGTTAIVKKQLLDFRELIDYMRIDLSKCTKDVEKSITQYENDDFEEGYFKEKKDKDESIPYANDGNGNIRQPISPLAEIVLDGYESDTFNETVRFDLKEKSHEKKDGNGGKIELSAKGFIEIGAELQFKTYFEGDIFNVTGHLTKSFALGVEGEAAITQALGEIKLGFEPVSFSIIPRIKLSVSGEIKYETSKTYDFHISLFGESYVDEHEPVSGFQGSAKLELSIGLDIGVNFISKHLFRLSIEPEIGVRATLEGVGENGYKRHNCSNCVSVQCCLFGRVTFHVHLCGYDYNNKKHTDDEVSEYELEDSTEPKEFHIKDFKIYDGPCDNLSHKIKLSAYEIGDAGNISGIVKDASYYIKTSKFDYVELSSKADEDIEKNSDGSIEVWLNDKILIDEKCVILAKSATGAKGKIAVGQRYDPTLARMNEFNIILDNDTEDFYDSPEVQGCGYDPSNPKVYEVDYSKGDTTERDTGNGNTHIQKNINGRTVEIDIPNEWIRVIEYGYAENKKDSLIKYTVIEPTDDVIFEEDDFGNCNLTGAGVVYWEVVNAKLSRLGHEVEKLIIWPGVRLSDGDYNSGLASSKVKEIVLMGINGEVLNSCFLASNPYVEKVSLSDIKVIDKSAFGNCAKLSEVEMDNSVEIIGDSAFNNCFKLEEFVCPNYLESINAQAFYNCMNLKNVKFNKYLKTIGVQAFSFTSLKSVDIPSSVSTIEDQAFYDCKNLSQVKLNEGLQTIGEGAFYHAAINSMNIPSSVKEINTNAFYQCNNLKTVIINGDIEKIGSNVFTNDNKSVESVIINNGVTEIPGKAFRNLMGLKYVRFSDNLNKINEEVFQDCDRLEKVNLPDSLVYIEDRAFNDCNSVRTVNLSKNLKYIGKEAFRNNTSLQSITIPASVEEIGEYAFAYNPLNDLTIENGVKKIDKGVFYGTKIKSVEIPPSVSEIGKDAFNTIYSEKVIDIENAYTYKTTLRDIYIYNPDCELTEGFIAHNETYKVTLHGYKDSTAYEYYEKYKDYVNFEELEAKTFTTNTTTAVTTTVTTKTTTVVTTNVSPNSECVVIAVNGIEVNEDTPSTKLLDNQNLRYFDQQSADRNGVVSFSYVPNENENWTFMFISEAIDDMVQRTVVTINDFKAEVESQIKGDANGDGQIDMSDAVLIMQALANPNKYGINGTDPKHISADGFKYADADGNGLTVNDAQRIQLYLLGKISTLD